MHYNAELEQRALALGAVQIGFTETKPLHEQYAEKPAIAVCGGKEGVISGAFPPCGVCRQVMREFCEDDFMLYLVDENGFEAHTLAEILPFSFSAKKHMGG